MQISTFFSVLTYSYFINFFIANNKISVRDKKFNKVFYYYKMYISRKIYLHF